MHDNPWQTARESQTCTTRPTEATEGPTEEEAEEDYRITPRDWVESNRRRGRGGLRRGTGFYCIYCRFTVDLRTRPTEEEAEEDYAEGLGFTAFTVDLRDQSDRTSYTHTRITYFNILQITHILHILTFSIFTFSLNPPRQEG